MRLDKIEVGDSKILSKEIPDESVDAVFTDPVYGNLEDYRWLAEEAKRVLKPNKPLLVWCSLIKQFDVKVILDEYLTFRYPLYYTVVAKTAPLYSYKVNIWTTPCLVFSKGKYKPNKWVVGTITSSRGPETSHIWNKNEAPVNVWLSNITYPDDIIWDPFAGCGVVPAVCKRWRRHFFASEIDHSIAKNAQERIKCVRPYLF